MVTNNTRIKATSTKVKLVGIKDEMPRMSRMPKHDIKMLMKAASKTRKRVRARIQSGSLKTVPKYFDKAIDRA